MLTCACSMGTISPSKYANRVIKYSFVIVASCLWLVASTSNQQLATIYPISGLSRLKNGKFRRKERQECKKRKGFLDLFLSILCPFAPLRQSFSSD
jgi:hypothetical protein